MYNIKEVVKVYIRPIEDYLGFASLGAVMSRKKYGSLPQG
jgi:hypothetical protein